ncbi:MAG: hypothetical protein Q9162_002338 [Coniocarpon cinnabarinum]
MSVYELQWRPANKRGCARCTSAAPWYFKAKALKYLGTFQDGGLRHNNPIALALWESRSIWPDRGDADLALSLGTGTSRTKPPTAKRGPFSPVKDRFLPRLIKSLMVNIDGEKTWAETLNNMSKHSKTRLHRLNTNLEDRYLSLDEISNIVYLKDRTIAEFHGNNNLDVICDSILASSFYFELDSAPEYRVEGLICRGSIYCRLQLSATGRQALCSHLKDQRAFFLVNGRPYRAVDTCSGRTPFKKKVSVTVASKQDTIGVTLRHSTSLPLLISGLPKTVEELMKLQIFDAPFGRPDHQISEKPLPAPPSSKRSGSATSQHPRRWTLRSSVKRIRLG